MIWFGIGNLNLNKIFAACLVYGYITLAWRAVRVIFIPKPGRDSYELAKSFRPISLTSFFLKTMEKPVAYIRARPLKSFSLMDHTVCIPERQIH
jgi:hypothetical protein